MGSMDKLLRKSYNELKAKKKEARKNDRFLRKVADIGDPNPWAEDFEEILMSDKALKRKEINKKINSNYKDKYAKKPEKAKYDYEDDIPF